MSTVLLDSTVEHLRAAFTRQELATVQIYGGEFSSGEIQRVSFSCPAVLVTVLGWQPATSNSRLRSRHARSVRMAAFVLTKNARRDLRLAEAMTLAGKLCTELRNWVPTDSLPITVAPLAAAPAAENLYGRLVDEQGMALWLVDWTQDAEPHLGDGAEVFDLVRIEIDDATQPGVVPATAAGGSGLVVTEQVRFETTT